VTCPKARSVSFDAVGESRYGRSVSFLDNEGFQMVLSTARRKRLLAAQAAVYADGVHIQLP
jgi:hypothetical protein